jgi:hypothetical protein
MKKFIFYFLICFLIGLPQLFAAGTLTHSSTTDLEQGLSKKISIAGTGDVSAGTFPACTIDVSKSTGINVAGKNIASVIIDPGNSTAPNGLTVKLYDSADYAANSTNAFDLLGGNGASLSTTTTTKLIPVSPILVNDNLVVAVTGNTTGSATVTIYINFKSN